MKLRIEQLENLKCEEQHDREKFYEGAAWFGKEAVEVATKACDYVKDHLRKDFRRKLDDCGKDDLMRQRVCEWVMDQSERTVKEVRDQCQDKLESALRSKSVALKLLTK